LELVAESDKPIGRGALNLLLRWRGFRVSPPTVGRRLQELEFEGMLAKVSVEGRVITARGRDVLAHWSAETRLRLSGNVLSLAHDFTRYVSR
jgi:repressor of nif and glnA expression